jgi:hypothetical protein
VLVFLESEPGETSIMLFFTYRGYNNVYLFALVREDPHFRFDEFLGHNFSVSACAISFFLDVNFYKFCT